MESIIASFVDGRIRLRHTVLKNSQIMQQVEGFVRTLSGVLAVECNVRTGSLLFLYDPDMLDEATLNTLLEQAEMLLGQESESLINTTSQESTPQTGTSCLPCTISKLYDKFLLLPNKKGFKRTLGALVPLTVALAMTNKRYHAIAGGLFVALSLGHMWRKRNALL